MKNNFSFWCQTSAVDAILLVLAGVPPYKKEKTVMKCTKIMLAGFVTLSMTAFAMPTPEQTKKVESLVVDLMRDDQAAFKSGKKTRAEVAESAIRLANQADSEAAKLLLIKGAYNNYVKAGEFDKAIETLQRLQTVIPDIPPANLANIIESSLRNVPRKNGGQLYRLLDETKTRMRYTNEVKALEKSVKEKPGDRKLRQKLAEHYAYFGDWDAALENFAATDGKIGEIAKAERDGKGETKKVADFWWDYPKDCAKGAVEELEKCFHVHAARLYEKAIASGDVKGLNKVQAERRIEEVKGYEGFVCPAKANDSKNPVPSVEYKFTYKLENGLAIITGADPKPAGTLVVPGKIDGCSVTCIGRAAFRNCKDLTSVTIPEGVTYIDVHAFDGCVGLESVTLPSSLKSIGYAVFGGCAGLKSVAIPNGVKSIAADAFNGCGLKSVVIPSSVTSIGDRAFCGCKELESVAIPAEVENLGKGVLTGCNALKRINVDPRNQVVTSIDGVLYTKDRSVLVMWPNPPTSVVIPRGVTNIKGWAFAGGRGMASVTIPESVTNIGDVVFLGCEGLKSMTIPSSVKNIGEHAFHRCRELVSVTMLGERPELEKDNIFDECGNLKSIHVSANAKSWKGMKEWLGIPLVFDAK